MPHFTKILPRPPCRNRRPPSTPLSPPIRPYQLFRVAMSILRRLARQQPPTRHDYPRPFVGVGMLPQPTRANTRTPGPKLSQTLVVWISTSLRRGSSPYPRPTLPRPAPSPTKDVSQLRSDISFEPRTHHLLYRPGSLLTTRPPQPRRRPVPPNHIVR